MQELRGGAFFSARGSPRALDDRCPDCQGRGGNFGRRRWRQIPGQDHEWRLITEKHDIENLLEVRIALEGIAAANVARDGSQADMAKLGTLLAKMKSSVKDKKQFAALDLEFHVTLAKASGNSLLFDLICMIRNQLVTALDKLLLPQVGRLPTKNTPSSLRLSSSAMPIGRAMPCTPTSVVARPAQGDHGRADRSETGGSGCGKETSQPAEHKNCARDPDGEGNRPVSRRYAQLHVGRSGRIRTYP